MSCVSYINQKLLFMLSVRKFDAGCLRLFPSSFCLLKVSASLRNVCTSSCLNIFPPMFWPQSESTSSWSKSEKLEGKIKQENSLAWRVILTKKGKFLKAENSFFFGTYLGRKKLFFCKWNLHTKFHVCTAKTLAD